MVYNSIAFKNFNDLLHCYHFISIIYGAPVMRFAFVLHPPHPMISIFRGPSPLSNLPRSGHELYPTTRRHHFRSFVSDDDMSFNCLLCKE